MTVAEFLEKCGGGRKSTGDKWSACCPAHDDRTPSLSVWEGRDGRVMFGCYANCDKPAILAALGLTWADVSPAKQERTPDLRPGPVVTWHDYTDVDGTLAYRVERTKYPDGTKRIRPYSPSGSLGLNGTNRILYRLPELIEGVAEGRRAYIVEGEPKVEELRARGLCATTSGSATSWRTEYAQHFKDADIIVLTDNDKPGRQYGETIVASLTSVAKSVRAVQLPGLPDGGDVVDWFTAGRTLEELLAIVDGPGTTDPTAPPGFTRLSDIDPNVTIEWLISDHLIRGDLSMWVGDDGVMKTTLDLLRGLAVAGGHALFNRFDTIQGPVMIVSGEDPEGVLRNRADAICRGHGWNADATLANVHVLCLAGVDMREREWQDRILAAAREIKPVLVIFDPLAEIATGDENSNSERSALARAFRRICGEVGASVDIVAHYKKPQGDNPDARKADRIRGANAIAKASRTTYAVERGPDDTIIVECLKFSRGKLRDRFAVRPYIVTAEDNEAIWHSARFEYVSVQEAVLDAAHTFVLEQLAGGVRMSTTDLKEAATASNQRRPSGSKISGVSISRAIKVLEMRKAIDFTPGDKGAKQWGLCLPGNLGNQNNVLAGQPDCLPGNHSGDESCLPSPLIGGNQASRTSEVAA